MLRVPVVPARNSSIVMGRTFSLGGTGLSFPAVFFLGYIFGGETLLKDDEMKTIATLAAAAFVFAAGSAAACEWSKGKQSVKAPETTTVATASVEQSTPVKN